MKHAMILILICLMLAGCATAPEPTAPPTTAATDEATAAPTDATEATEAATEIAPELSYILYRPDENAESFLTQTVRTDRITADSVLAELQMADVLPEEVIINAFGAEGERLNIDFNIAFSDLVCSMGTSGERMIIGSVVNTFLNAFQAESVFFTVEGQILESGHVVYDLPITHMD